MTKIKDMDSKTFISLEYRGPIEDLPYKDYIKKLKKWAKKKKAKPYGKPFFFYYHPYEERDEDKFRIDVAKPIKNFRKGGDGYKIKFLPKMTYAAKNFKGTPSDHQEAFEEIYEWIEEEGYRPYGNRMEVIKRKPKMKKGELRIKSQLRIPVQKKV
ncbi:MAG: GyrI-like domain-containing protein [Candidatus Thermoplasmatota archaeon]|nr:GyrI-like domain-containing protein [Candidatus Thermoplasmatota archaeon]